ncbi:hypothetical protein L7F22_020598 [Adiantum nelumboides]|nr:hypothetical protein [Adiantum nelumboides]
MEYQRELAAKITENLEKKKPEILECSEARTVQRISVAVTEALLMETQTMGTGSIPVDSSKDNRDSEKEQDEVEVQMCQQRIQPLTIELEDTRKSLRAVAKFIKQKKKQAEAMTVEVPQIKDDEEKMGITNYKPAPFTVRMADQRIVQLSGLLENLHIKVGSEKFKTSLLILDVQGTYGMLLGRPWLRSAKAVQDYANQVITIQGEQPVRFNGQPENGNLLLQTDTGQTNDFDKQKSSSSTSTANTEEEVSPSEQMYEYCSNDEVDNNPTTEVKTDKEAEAMAKRKSEDEEEDDKDDEDEEGRDDEDDDDDDDDDDDEDDGFPGVAMGAILAQSDGKADYPMYFASRRFNKAEQGYSTTEREALGMIFSATKFRHYLLGKFFVFYVDHQALLYLINKIIFLGTVRVESLRDEPVDAELFQTTAAAIEELDPKWMEVQEFLQSGKIPEDWPNSRKKGLIVKCLKFTFIGGSLYRLGIDGV